MTPRILLVNPPIYDFSAYDFWLKRYGMLRAAGFLRGQADFHLFDFLDRLDSRVPAGITAATAGGAARSTRCGWINPLCSPISRGGFTVSAYREKN
jgi:hypothetical protein